MASMSIEKRGRVDVSVGHGWRLSYTFEFPTVDSKLSDRCPNRAPDATEIETGLGKFLTGSGLPARTLSGIPRRKTGARGKAATVTLSPTCVSYPIARRYPAFHSCGR
uniref:Uncharacterized protein n=1 Tax=Candidatus Kentrum sp. LFY TaxID=2126342 RepID=A0A450WXF7_9GAMM|nr:MAG: hypothetical protein BECKLFY1418C_GA0070996_110012 [Candidatus Kentron sp. LFY]